MVHNPKAFALSVVLQTAVVATLICLGTNESSLSKMTPVTLIVLPSAAKLTPAKTKPRGGGGQPTPALQRPVPRVSPKVFTPPLIADEHPALVIDASLVTSSDAWLAPASTIGNLMGAWVGAGTGNIPGPGSGSGGIDRGDAQVFTVGKGTVPPAVLSKVDPEYSEEARKAKYSGAVMLSVVVNTDGRAGNITVVRSLGMGLDEKAVEAVQQWRFRPGMNQGIPVRVRAQIEVNLRLL
jgi:protein TonB